MSWSNSHARAVASVWSSSAPGPNGRSCFGCPSRLEPPAARTRPVTLGRDIALQVRRAATLGAEVDALAVAVQMDRCITGEHGHAADRVDRLRRGCAPNWVGAVGRGCGRRMRDATGDELAQDRDRDPLRRACADREPRRRVQLLAQGIGHVERVAYRRAALVARDQGDVPNTGLEGACENRLLRLAV